MNHQKTGELLNNKRNEVKHMKPVYSGKVREIYDISDRHLVIVTTDRISAFDNILPMPVKGKGIVLNKLSNFWFDKTRNIVPNHIIDDRGENMPPFFQDEYFRERTVMVKKLNIRGRIRIRCQNNRTDYGNLLQAL